MSSQSDFSYNTITVKFSRIWQLDFIRGLAIAIISFDHVSTYASIDLPDYFKFTPNFWALCDFADVLFFVSGITFGLVYNKRITEIGFTRSLSKVIKRSFYIFSLNVIATTVLWLASLETTSGFKSQLIQGILPTYTFILPYGFIVLFISRNYPRAAMAISLALYIVSQANFPPDYWGSFNPLAYQLEFTLGLFAYSHIKVIHKSIVLLSAGAMLLLTIGLRIIPALAKRELLPISHIGLPVSLLTSKLNAGPLRIIYLLSAAILVYHLIKLYTPRKLSKLSFHLECVGKVSLETYIVIDILNHMLVKAYIHSSLQVAIASLIAFSLSIPIAYTVIYVKRNLYISSHIPSLRQLLLKHIVAHQRSPNNL